MRSEMYGTITLDVSRLTDCENGSIAKYESYDEVNEYNIEEFLLETINRLGLEVHNAEIHWNRFFSEDE